MIVCVGSPKGGVGKTTLSVNLAIGLSLAGQDVLLIDGDELGHAVYFTENIRTQRLGQPGYTAVALHGSAIRTQVLQLKHKYDQIVIDVGGRDTASLRAALLVATAVLVPVVPRSFDLWGTDSMTDLVSEARTVNEDLKAWAVLNAADPTGTDNQDAIDALKEMEGLEVLPTRLVRRKALPNAAAMGLGVLEYNGDGADKAQEEFRSLFHHLYPRLERKIRDCNEKTPV